jgi:hypothetical protein
MMRRCRPNPSLNRTPRRRARCLGFSDNIFKALMENQVASPSILLPLDVEPEAVPPEKQMALHRSQLRTGAAERYELIAK